MSVDVGDPFEVIFRTVPGAAVKLSWYNPMEIAVLDQVDLIETPAGSGQYPKVLTATDPGMWRAVATVSGTTSDIQTMWERAVITTGLPPLAAVSDVRQQRPNMTDAEAGLAVFLLRAASHIVRDRYRIIDQQIADGTLSSEVVALAVTNMVLRVLRNPDGLRARTTGPFSRTYDTSKAAGLLYLDDTELVMLEPAPSGSSMVAGTIIARPGLAPAPWGIRSWMGSSYGRRRGGW